MDILDAISISSGSGQSSSSPRDSPSRSSTPSQSSASSDFLSSDGTPLTPWTPYSKHATVSLLNEDNRKPSLDPYYSLGMSNTSNALQTTPPRGILLEDLMQEDVYENGPLATLLQPSTLISSFDPSLPDLPSYPSSISSTSEESSHPPTVQLSPTQETVGRAGDGDSPLSPTVTSASNAFESSSLQDLLVTVPNGPCPNTSVVMPSRHTIGNLPILIHNVPAVGAKSRVETQIKMTLDLAIPRDSQSGYERVGSWKWLRLPKGTSTRRRPRKEPKIDAHPDDTITLSVAVTCASVPSMPVSACTNCLAREAKRVDRKKAARVRPQRHDSSDSDDEGAVFRAPTDGKATPRDSGNSGIVVFNCPDVNDFSEGRVVLPVRVTCYCRHHREKIGFRIAFTMTDSRGRVIGRGCTPAIMITDDHKSVVKSAPHVPPQEEEDPQPQPKRNKRRLVTKDSDVAEADREPKAKRRVKETTPPTPTPASPSSGNQQGSVASFFPHFESSPRFTHRSAQSPSTFTTAPSSPAANALNIPSPAASSAGVFLHYPITNDVQMQQPPAIDSFIQNEQLDAMSPLVSGIGVPPPKSTDLQAPPVDPLFSALTFQPAPPDGPSAVPPPQIHRLIPASGPTHGGIEVTVLGVNFLPTHRCVFGDTPASTNMWSDTTLVCVLPPSATPGPVVVGFEGLPLDVGGGVGGGAPDGRGGLQLFNYLDNSDRALMELALQVVGLKMTGRIEEAKDVAMRIVGTSSPGGGDPGLTSGGASGFNSLGMSMDDDDIVHSALHGQGGRSDTRPLSASSTRDFQSVIIEFLKLLEVDVPTTSAVTIREAISHISQSGQTLLHLGAILGFHRLLKHLITLEVDLDVRDANGYTALHFAALCGRVACARILVEGGADIEIVDARGRLAREIAQWRDQIDVQELLESHEHWLMSATDNDADESAAGLTNEAQSEEDPEESGEWNTASPTATIKPAPVEVPDPILLAAFLPEGVHGMKDSKTDDTLSFDEKKLLSEKILADVPEKNPQSLLHRTLSQLPTPGLPTFPPMPDFLPNMPGFPIPQWGFGLPNQLQFPALHFPDIPLVFPVQVPTPSWPAALQWPGTGAGVNGEKRPEGGYPIPSGTSPSWLGLYPGWFATNAVEKGQDPPMYTPPAPSSSPVPPTSQSATVTEPSTQTLPNVAEPPSVPETGSGATTPTVRSTGVLRNRPARRQAHATERELRPHAPQVKKKQQQTTSDFMLFFFWIPILIVVLLYGAYVAWNSIHDALSHYLPLLRGRLIAAA